MGEGLDRIGERTRQIREAQRARMLAEVAEAQQRAAARAGGPAIGARVFDVVSGEEGEVVGHAAENIIVPAAQR